MQDGYQSAHDRPSINNEPGIFDPHLLNNAWHIWSIIMDSIANDYIEGIDQIVQQDNYDPAKRRYRSVFVPIMIFFSITAATFIFSFIMDIPYIFSVSYFALALTLAAASYDNWVLNSVAIPISSMFIVVLIGDIFITHILAFFVHLPTVLASMILFKKNNTSFRVMLMASVCVSFWVYTDCYFTFDVYYSMILGMTDPLIIAIASFVAATGVSIVKTALSYYFKFHRKEVVDCPNDICPW